MVIRLWRFIPGSSDMLPQNLSSSGSIDLVWGTPINVRLTKIDDSNTSIKNFDLSASEVEKLIQGFIQSEESRLLS